jgi:hypothetical protein
MCRADPGLLLVMSYCEMFGPLRHTFSSSSLVHGAESAYVTPIRSAVPKSVKAELQG